MRSLDIIKRFAMTTLLSVAVILATGQDSPVVSEGETFELGVVPVPGETYLWQIFTDHTLEVEAGPPDVVFVDGNTGSHVEVRWETIGTYYYTVTAIGVNGCMNLKVGLIKVTKMTVMPTISIRVNRNPICPGDPVVFTSTVVLVRPGSDPIYQWYKNGLPVGENSRTYTDSLLKNRDEVWCQFTSSSITENPVTVSSNRITMEIETLIASFEIHDNIGGIPGRVKFVNQSIGAKYYYWTFGNGTFSFDKNPVTDYSDDGTYLIKLTAFSPIHCTDTCAYPFTLLFKGLYIPNAFAPTVSNGLGGTFKPAGVNLRRYRIEIYDNWGHLLWESTKLDDQGRPAEAWDGTYQGELMPQGTYMWKASAEFVDGTIWQGPGTGAGGGQTFGTVTLLR